MDYRKVKFSIWLSINSLEAVDPSSGTLLVELQVSNDDGALKSGAYAQASFVMPASGNTVTIPPSALLMGNNGTQVGVVSSDGKVELRVVKLGRDLGKVLEIVSGLNSQNTVIINPPDSLQNGDQVRVVGSAENK